MDGFGGISSALTILDVAWKIKDLHVRTKHAEQDWRHYCNALQTVASMRYVIESLRIRSPGIDNITIASEDGKGSTSFLESIDAELSAAIEAPKKLLETHSLFSPSILKRYIKRWRFVLDKDIIDGMMARVETAQGHLHMALTMASLDGIEKRQDYPDPTLPIAACFRLTPDAQVSKTIEDSLKFQVEYQQEQNLTPSQGRPEPRGLKPGIVSSLRKNLFRRSKGKNNCGGNTPSLSGQSGLTASLVAENGDESDDDRHDAQPLTEEISAAEWKPLEPLDISQEYRPLAPSAPPLVEEAIECLSESEWDDGQYIPADELMDFLTSVQPTEDASDEDMTASEPSSPIEIRYDNCESHLLVAQMVNLDTCRPDGESHVWKFCIDRVSINNLKGTQAFCVIGPCADQRSSRCGHITMDVKNADFFETVTTPCLVRLAQLGFEEQSGDGVNDTSDRCGHSMKSFSCTNHRRKSQVRSRCRRHTVFEDNLRIGCAYPVRLFAVLPERPSEGSDVSPERAPSDTYDDVDNTNENQDNAETAHATGNDQLPERLDSDDDAHAFYMLRMIARNNTYTPEPLVDLDELIRFMKLVDTYRQHVGVEPLNQARIWASRIRPSETFDRNAIPWLWVLLKLGKGPEFNQLSAIVQQQARSSISQWQNGPQNEHGIKLPDMILEQMDQGRTRALSTIKYSTTWHIWRTYCEYFASVFHHNWGEPFHPVMFSSPTDFEHLVALERDSSPESQELGQGISNLDFEGVSFADVKQYVLSTNSMREVEDWGVCEIRIFDKAPRPLSLLTTAIPTLKIRLNLGNWNGRTHQKDITNIFTALLKTLEQKECWGVDLSEINDSGATESAFFPPQENPPPPPPP
ncbi:hypothetical protein V8F33_008967 [Rhypophila sp. PSN 637]